MPCDNVRFNILEKLMKEFRGKHQIAFYHHPQMSFLCYHLLNECQFASDNLLLLTKAVNVVLTQVSVCFHGNIDTVLFS